MPMSRRQDHQISMGRKVLAVISILVTVLNPSCLSLKVKEPVTVKPIIYVDRHRLVNWCVTGEDEPELQYYPYSDFIPYFQKTEQSLVLKKDSSGRMKYDYSFEISGAKYKERSKMRGDLLNVGHFKFKAFELNDSAYGIVEKLVPKPIEGLAIQINWAPYGVGIPANFQFVDNDVDIVCFDCEFPYGIPIGCRRRPADAIIHPTIMVFHHRMRISKQHIRRRQELYDVRERDDNEDAVMQKKRQDAINAATSTVRPPGAGPPAPPTVAPPPTTLPPCETKFETEKRKECKIVNFLPEGDNDPGSFLRSQAEIHGTLQWFLPPCSVTRGIEVQVLVIHSFLKNEFEIFSLGPYEIPTAPDYPNKPTDLKHNPYIPSPFFHGFQSLIECDDEEQGALLFYINDYATKYRHPFDYSRSYELCMRNEEDYKSTADYPQVCSKPELTVCDAKNSKFMDKVNVVCSDIQCLSEITTSKPRKPGRIVRRLHGGINMVTNFCLQPIFIFIGRYYKETFNRWSWKGQKLWYWIHMVGGMIASVCQYIGFFHYKFVQGSLHVFFGEIMMMMLGITYVAAWIRHKSPWRTAAAEFIHGMCGYTVSVLAFFVLHTAPGVTNTALILIYAATGLLVLAYIVMETCLCVLDRKFGMQPRRRHLPTIEARLDDLPVPQTGYRVTLLVITTILMLILTIVSNFV